MSFTSSYDVVRAEYSALPKRVFAYQIVLSGHSDLIAFLSGINAFCTHETWPPRGAFQDKTGFVLFGNGGVGLVIVLERFATVLPTQKDEGGKIGQIDTVVENQSGFNTTVREEKRVRQLGRASRYRGVVMISLRGLGCH